MDFSCFKGFIKSNGQSLKDRNGRIMDPKKFRALCVENDILFKSTELQEHYLRAVVDLQEQPNKLLIADALDETEVFEGFKAKGDGVQPSLIYVKLNDTKTLCLGSSKDLTYREVYQTLSSNALLHPILHRWQRLLDPMAEQFKLNITDLRQVVEIMWEKRFTAAVTMENEIIDFEAPPAIIDGFGKGTEYTIPFTKKHSTLDDLNHILNSFLSRMKDHKHFCAILASRLIGFKWHYIPWIYGKGGDGKSSFTRFLKLIIPNGVAEIKLGDTNGLWEALGKTFLIFGDTSNKNLVFYEEVKKISGGDPISISGKYKHARTEVLPGQIIITSNRLPSVGASEAIKRRTRVFSVEAGTFQNTDKEVSVETAASSMHESVNAFLNYCIQCLEEVGDIKTGKVPDHPSNITHKNQKTSEELEFNDFMEKLKLVYGSHLSIKGSELRGLLKQGSDRNEYFKDNFIEYAQNNEGVTFDGNRYYGIGKESQPIENDRENKIKELIESRNSKK